MRWCLAGRRPEELRHLLYDFVTSVRTSSLAEGSDGAAMQGLAGADGAPPGSPGRGGAPPLGGLGSSALGRVTVARWLLFFFKQQQEEGEEEAEAGGDDDDAGEELLCSCGWRALNLSSLHPARLDAIQ